MIKSNIRKKGWWTVNNFYDVIKPFDYVARLFGFCSMAGADKLSKSKSTKCTKILELFLKYGIITSWVLVFSFIIYVNLMKNLFEHLTNNEIANITRRALLFVGIITTFFGIFTTYLVKKKLHAFLMRLVEFDREMKRLGSPVNLILESKIMMFYIMFKVCLCAGFITVSSKFFDTCDEPIHCVYMHWPYYGVNVTLQVFTSHFIVFGYALVRRYQLLNMGFW